MKPIVPIPRKPSGFSIASIMGQDDPDKQTPSGSSEDSDSGDETPRPPARSPDEVHRQSIASRLPPLHPALPAHVKQLLLSGSSDAGGDSSPELQALRTQAWAFGSQHLGAFPALGVNNFGLPAQLAQQGLPGFGPAGPALHPGLVTATRDPLSMYPWMLNRPPASMLGLPYGHPDAGFFFHPYRKPKRIRTAFSPTQLLKLEHAFEKNHYVVGQERKELASKLNLTESQVKVWFQNRRTKHKRVRSDDEADGDNENISIDDECTATSSYNDDVTDDVTDHEEICPQ